MRRCLSLLFPVGLLVLSCCAGSTLLDPFGMPPLPAVPNCGPERRYQFPGVRIRSEQEFVEFLQSHEAELSDMFGYSAHLDNFRDVEPGVGFPEKRQAPIAWDEVLAATTTQRVWGRAVYRLDYVPFECPGQGFTLKMTRRGHVSVYGCCGI